MPGVTSSKIPIVQVWDYVYLYQSNPLDDIVLGLYFLYGPVAEYGRHLLANVSAIICICLALSIGWP